MLLRVTEPRDSFTPFAIEIDTNLGEDNPHDFDCLSLAAVPGETVRIDWGDDSGLQDYDPASDASVLLTHYYDVPGKYIIRITGDLISVDTLTDSGSRSCIETILSFGERLTSARFEECLGLKAVMAGVLPFNLERLCFRGCSDLTFVNCANWNTSTITDMSYMFAATPAGNLDISQWDTSNVVDMSYMLDGFGGYFQGGLQDARQGVWDTRKVVNMSHMFSIIAGLTISDLRTIGIEDWDTSAVTDMSHMFKSSQLFFDSDAEPTVDFSRWNTSNVTDMSFMFRGSLFKGTLGDWDTSKVTTMQSMFARSRFDDDISGWDVGSVTNMSRMFEGRAISGWDYFNQPIGGWDVSNVTDMSFMFFQNREFNQPLNSWDVRRVTDITSMFQLQFSALRSPFNQPLDNWDIEEVTAATNFMFQLAGSAYSTLNWDNLLVAWNSRKAKYFRTLNIRCPARTSTAGGGAAAKADLRAYGWTITDGGNI